MSARPSPATQVEALLRSGVERGTFPAASAWIAVDHQPAVSVAAGNATVETRFDLASLTKPMVVGELAMRGVSEGWLHPTDPLQVTDETAFTLHALLSHGTGLPAWDDLSGWLDQTCPGWRPHLPETEAAIAARLKAICADADREIGTVYSDVGYIVLGRWFESRMGRSLGSIFEHYGPLSPGMTETAAATGRCPRRGRLLKGEVHDINTWAMGGAAGHAGLFGTAEQVGRWALTLARLADGKSPLSSETTLDGGVVRAFWNPDNKRGSAPADSWVLGWDTPSAGYTSAGKRASPTAVGHLGFTGTSVWIDREQTLVMVLLTNRVAAETQASGDLSIREFRPFFHDEVREIFGR